jgi:hypothetical protein
MWIQDNVSWGLSIGTATAFAAFLAGVEVCCYIA